MARVSITTACDLAGITPGTLRVWRQRARAAANKGNVQAQIVDTEFFAPPEGGFDRDGALFLSIVGELVKAGLPVWDAAEGAIQVTELSTFASGQAFGIGEEQPVREPGQLFSTGRTVLASKRQQDCGKYDHRVFPLAGPKNEPDETFISLLSNFTAPGAAVTLLDVSSVAERVDAAFSFSGAHSE